jgi:hypothetical protein
MIVSHRRRFLFLHNPKCAGTSLRMALATHHDDPVTFWGIRQVPTAPNLLDHAHLRLWEVHTLFPHLLAAAETYRSVVLVRNPHRRFASALDEHFRVFRGDLQLGAMSAAERTRTIEAFIETTLTEQAVATDFRLVHFSPQTWFIHLEGQQVPNHILPIDDHGSFVADTFACLGLAPQPTGWHNQASMDLMHIFDSPLVAGFVRDFYAQDFAFFATDPLLAGLVERPMQPQFVFVDVQSMLMRS